MINETLTISNYLVLLSGAGLILFVVQQGLLKENSSSNDVGQITVKKSNELIFTLKKYKEHLDEL